MMHLRSVFEWVDALPSSVAIRESQYLYATLLTSHVIGMCMFAGLIVMMDLRLVGVGNRRTSFSQIQRRLFPWQMLGMTVSATTGLLLVYADPLRFYANIYFWIKAVMMVLAGVNALAFHQVTYRTIDSWDTETVTPFGAKLAGAMSLVLWAAVVVSGRLIAYNWFTQQ
jgi:uncharacterized protein DUF6644